MQTTYNHYYMKLLFFFLLLLTTPTLLGQTSKYGKLLHVNTSPQYKQWKKNYSISKIHFFEKRIVLTLELVFSRGSTQWTKSVIFLPPNTDNSWCLKDTKTNQVFNLIEIRAVRQNGKEIKSCIKSNKDKVHIELPLQGIPKEIFTCEVHFPILPKTTQSVDLLEGANSKFLEGHWNFFSINIPFTNTRTTSAFSLLPQKSKNNGSPQLQSINDIKCNKTLELSNITFQDNSTKFQNKTTAERSLYILRTYLQQFPNSSIELFGHTDVFGTPQRNLELSQKRVNKLRLWLMQQKITSERIIIRVLGDTQPLFPNGNPKNRRVEAKIICSTTKN